MSPRVSRAPDAVSRRRDFASFGASRSRARSGPIRVTFAAFDGPDEPQRPADAVPQVAYGIGRNVGTAVVRNRLRRRLRVVMRECLADDLLAPGRFLVSAGPAAADLGFDELRDHVSRALGELP